MALILIKMLSHAWILMAALMTFRLQVLDPLLQGTWEEVSVAIWLLTDLVKERKHIDHWTTEDIPRLLLDVEQ